MLNLITQSFSLFFIALTGWILTTYLIKEDSQKFIKEELLNFFDICKMLFVSLKSLIAVLTKAWSSPESIEESHSESNVLEVVEAVETMGFVPSVEGMEEDTELSQFSPELVEAITEEEEKVA